MSHKTLRQLLILALCCDLGLFSKRLIAPLANLLTDALHIPGGIATGFSLLFLVLAAALTERFGSAALMGAVQSVLALSFGMVGSMGLLAPIGYILPGLVIDLVLQMFGRTNTMALLSANMLASATAALTANLIVFHLRGAALVLYLSVALTAGAFCGLGAAFLYRRLRPYYRKGIWKE